MMYIIRTVEKQDLASLYYFSSLARGMTTLPHNESALRKLIDCSLKSFAKDVSSIQDEYYIFVLEDMTTKEIVGTSAIKASSAFEVPSYFYEVSDNLLIPRIVQNGPSELCSLYLLPDHRKEKAGKLLSYSRFHFIKSFRNRFKNELIAELRGYITEDKKSPFWDALGGKRKNINYEQAEYLIAMNDPSFLEFFINEPILISSLSKEAQNAIGKTHINTQAALKLLNDQNFKWTHQIDIVDGGPKILAKVDSCPLIRDSEILTLSEAKKANHELYLISNHDLQFRSILTSEINDEVLFRLNVKNKVVISKL